MEELNKNYIKLCSSIRFVTCKKGRIISRKRCSSAILARSKCLEGCSVGTALEAAHFLIWVLPVI